MNNPVLNRALTVVCAVLALVGGIICICLLFGGIEVAQIANWLNSVDTHNLGHQLIILLLALVLIALGVFLILSILPSKDKRSSMFAIQHNENGMVRISIRALQTLVDQVVEEHDELKMVSSSIYSDEESVRIDLHINIQSNISMPLAISVLQKEIKKYLEACSGVMVQEVRVYVDSTIVVLDGNVNATYAIPASLLGKGQEQLPGEENPESVQQNESVEENAQVNAGAGEREGTVSEAEESVSENAGVEAEVKEEAGDDVNAGGNVVTEVAADENANVETSAEATEGESKEAPVEETPIEVKEAEETTEKAAEETAENQEDACVAEKACENENGNAETPADENVDKTAVENVDADQPVNEEKPTAETATSTNWWNYRNTVTTPEVRPEEKQDGELPSEEK